MLNMVYYFYDVVVKVKNMKSLEEFFSDLSTPEKKPKTRHKCITFWLPEEYADRYGRIQTNSAKQFSKKLRELVMLAIDKAEIKVS